MRSSNASAVIRVSVSVLAAGGFDRGGEVSSYTRTPAVRG
jgi:hypothetical protein